jgi:hypothetical protein
MLFRLVAKFVFAPQFAKSVEQLVQRAQQDLADGTTFLSPPIEVDKAQIASLTTQALTHDH